MPSVAESPIRGKHHALCEVQVLQAAEGRQPRQQGALYWRPFFHEDEVAQRLQHHVLPEMRRCCIPRVVQQHTQLGTVTNCVQPRRASLSSLGLDLYCLQS